MPREDDDTVPRLITPELQRAATSSQTQISIAQIAIDELRDVPGVELPRHSEIGVLGVLGRLGERFLEHGRKLAATDLSQAQLERDEARLERDKARQSLSTMRSRILAMTRADLTPAETLDALRDLTREVPS